MRIYIQSLKMFLKQIYNDSMLMAVCVAPLLAAAFFQFGVPHFETLLCSVLDKTQVLSPYYRLFDLFLAVITPYLLTFVSAMVMLTEMDENMAVYLAVTPIGKKGYLTSRLVFPAVIAFGLSCVLLWAFSLTTWSLGGVFLVCFLGSFICLPVAMLIVTLAQNRVEGMAMAKMAGLVLIGLPVPFFISGAVQYLFFWLPSFWTAQIFVDSNGFWIIPVLLTSLLWGLLLYRRFERKIM